MCLLVAGCHGATSTPPKHLADPWLFQRGQVHDQVDILFMLDDSPGTEITRSLPDYFPQLVQRLDALGAAGYPASYHFGVVTSDLGAGAARNGGCPVGGLGAKLQALGRAHGSGCLPPDGGLHYHVYDQIGDGSNVPTGQTLVTTLDCMAEVGTGGCGFEHPLEAVYRALHDCQSADSCTIQENLGFLRPDALLAVLFVTDEDDCSAPPDTDLFDQGAPYGYDASFRCTAYGIVCDQSGTLQLPPQGDSMGPLANCQGAPNPTGNLSGPPPAGQGKLFDMSRYLDFFRTLKPDPDDVILAALDAPAQPFATILGNPNVSGSTCTVPNPPTCVPELVPSCSASLGFFGDPGVRINQVASSVPNNYLVSMCDLDGAPNLVAWLGGAIAARVMGE